MQINGVQMKTPIYCKLEGKPQGDPPEIRYTLSAEWSVLDKVQMQVALDAPAGTASIAVPDPELGTIKHMSVKIKSTRAFLHGDKYRNVLIIWEEVL
ncbi:MAG: hypothetical protein Q4E07_03765 [Eubacteriales bacterium]|nr:hypothetical protein [Eubacteriales bacterium]